MHNGRYTFSDAAWALLFMAIFVPLSVGFLFTLFTVCGPWISSPPNWLGKLLGAVTALIAIILSWLVSLIVFGLLTRLFLSSESYERWRQPFENGMSPLSPAQKALATFALRRIKPRRETNAP
jgi:hypothetical protein